MCLYKYYVVENVDAPLQYQKAYLEPSVAANIARLKKQEVLEVLYIIKNKKIIRSFKDSELPDLDSAK